MSANWINNLDMLAQNGVLDYDAAAFVMDQNPRYIGRPSMPPSPFLGPIPPAPAIQQPKNDEFVNNDTKHKKNPLWKKLLLGAIVTTGLVFAIVKRKDIYSSIKNFKIDFSGIKNKLKNAGTYIKDFAVKYWNKFKSIFKKSNP